MVKLAMYYLRRGRPFCKHPAPPQQSRCGEVDAGVLPHDTRFSWALRHTAYAIEHSIQPLTTEAISIVPEPNRCVEVAVGITSHPRFRWAPRHVTHPVKHPNERVPLLLQVRRRPSARGVLGRR
jgi:hypothetical protein